MAKKLTADEVTFTLHCEPEDIPVEGNAMASGDDAVDKEAEQWVNDQLANGNEWAWCHVILIAEWEGLEGRDTLGACSYKSREDFMQPGGYFDDMKAQAFADLQAQVDRLGKAICV